MEPLLSVNNVSVRYGGLIAVRSVTFDVFKNEIVGILGANGAGKSSLLQAVMGVIPPSEGSIVFEGKPITKSSPEDTVRLGIALVPENRRIFNGLTVLENLRLGAISKQARLTFGERLEAVLSTFPDLTPRLRTSAAALSGGQQQQLSIARALMGNPRLVLLDEPSLGLSPLMVRSVLQSLAQLRHEIGITVIVADKRGSNRRDFGPSCGLESGPHRALGEIESD